MILQHSKTDQEGQGRKIAIPQGAHPDTCPGRSLREWISVADMDTSPLFRRVSRHSKVGQGSLNKDSIGHFHRRAVCYLPSKDIRPSVIGFGNHYHCARMGRRQLPRNLEG
jgi:hypothetical protein